MKPMLIVCLATVCVAQTPQKGKGVHVDLVAVANAIAAPEADAPGAQVITITREGRYYLGAQETTFEQIQTTVFERNTAVFVKADAAAPYSTVLRVVGAVPGAILLTESQRKGGAVVPMGVRVCGRAAK